MFASHTVRLSIREGVDLHAQLMEQGVKGEKYGPNIHYFPPGGMWSLWVTKNSYELVVSIETVTGEEATSPEAQDALSRHKIRES